MTDLNKLARGLIPLQRKAVMRAWCDGDTWWIRRGTGRGLMPLGITARSIDGAYLTPLGLALKAHIERTERHG